MRGLYGSQTGSTWCSGRQHHSHTGVYVGGEGRGKEKDENCKCITTCLQVRLEQADAKN